MILSISDATQKVYKKYSGEGCQEGEGGKGGGANGEVRQGSPSHQRGAETQPLNIS